MPVARPDFLKSPPRGNGLVIAAPRSGSGKTLVTLGLLGALRARGLEVAPAKVGPDYIDTAILSRVAGRPAVNLDPWAMSTARLQHLAAGQATGADLLLVEGVMGLFDGAADGRGSTADLAAVLKLPVILVVDADKQGQSIAALVSGFARYRTDVEIAGVIINRVATTRHEKLLTDALRPLGIPILGVLPRREALLWPERHLGLTLPGEMNGADALFAEARQVVAEFVDLNLLLALSVQIETPKIMEQLAGLPPLGQRIAIARDEAFSFIYQHIMDDWAASGAELSFFSPLQDQPASKYSDTVFLPGGYPELHGQKLSAASTFFASLDAARDRGALIYGECGGYMVLGEQLTDKAGMPYKMAGLLPIQTDISRPKRTLGYRRLRQSGALPWPRHLLGHEFHYSSASTGTPLFEVEDATRNPLPPMGAVAGRVMGSYAHVIDSAAPLDGE